LALSFIGQAYSAFKISRVGLSTPTDGKKRGDHLGRLFEI
jgi:hypothetical protein